MLQLMADLPGGDGYMCRCHEPDLKYLVAFESPVRAVQWCLLLQVGPVGSNVGGCVGCRGGAKGAVGKELLHIASRRSVPMQTKSVCLTTVTLSVTQPNVVCL